MSLCPWTSWQEWDDVYQWLYSTNVDLRRKGVGRVAAWKARMVVPALLEVTADLVACGVHEEDCCKVMEFSGQAVNLMYAMALTRFVNGAFDVCFVNNPGFKRDIKSVVGKFGLPPYIVSLRHNCSHRSLPSLDALKCAVDIGLRWLQKYYWEPQRQLHSKTVQYQHSVQDEFLSVGESKVPVKTIREILSKADSKGLAQLLVDGKVLSIPDKDYEVVVPVFSDLNKLPELSIAPEVLHDWWQTVSDVQQNRRGLITVVVCALIIAIHSPECSPWRRDFLAAWLGHYFKEQEISPTSEKIYQDADWKNEFATLQQNPGYYSEALLNILLPLVSIQLQDDAVQRNKELATLVTLSERYSRHAYRRPLRVASKEELNTGLIPGVEAMNKDTCEKKKRSELTVSDAPPRKRAKLTTNNWSVVQEATQKWIGCPLGLYPGQTTSSTFLDIKCTWQPLLQTAEDSSPMQDGDQVRKKLCAGDRRKIQRNLQTMLMDS